MDRPDSSRQDTDFELPDEDGVTLTVPRQRPKRPRHQAPIPPPPTATDSKTHLESIIQHCDNMFHLGKQKARKISPATVQFFSKIKRNARELLKPSKKLDKKERKQALKNLEVNMKYARGQWEQVHDQLKNSAFMLMEYRVYQDYGDYLAKNLNVITTGRECRIKNSTYTSGR
ncbi:Radical SAM protein [Lasiodiplodia theobromae]|uniref:Radical SAM protein n=1 Tax=Lasiodiplodia theobromae TaxID=45133 RepID=UPI0015C3B9BE|nr:Radical SAM protein [Lasiodiplodia theobromae]KAF4539598.1 Radical SAM protein [Lasiodiplodia theobromae]